MPAYLLGALLFALCMGIFIFQNSFAVTVHFLHWTTPEISLGIVILAAACAGALITFLLDSFRYFKIARTIKDLRNLNTKLQKKIDELSREQAKGKDDQGEASSVPLNQ